MITLGDSDDTKLYSTLQRHASEFEVDTGASVTLRSVGYSSLYSVIKSDQSSTSPIYDAFVLCPQWTTDFGEHLVDLTDSIDETFDWNDVMAISQMYAAKVEDKASVVSVPLDGAMQLLFYRTDLLKLYNKQPPVTWDEYIDLASFFNGKDLNGDGTADFGSCISMKSQTKSYWTIFSIAAPLLQYLGPQQGVFFYPDTMEPLVTSTAFEKALDTYKTLMDHGPDDAVDATVEKMRDKFVAGRCALTVDWGDLATLINNSEFRNSVSVNLTPGSKVVWNRETKELQQCTAEFCPYMLDNVNYAPFTAFGGWMGGVSVHSDSQVRNATLDFFLRVGGKQISLEDVARDDSDRRPYRFSNLNTTYWREVQGLPSDVTASYFSVLANYGLTSGSSTTNAARNVNSNIAWDLRLPLAQEYMQSVLDDALAEFLSGVLSASATAQAIYDNWQQITNSLGRDTARYYYMLSLGLEPDSKEGPKKIALAIAIPVGAFSAVILTTCAVVALLLFLRLKNIKRIMNIEEGVFDGKIEPSELVFRDQIAIGAFGHVYRAGWRGTEVAVKKVQSMTFNSDQRRELMREINILRTLRHPNIVLFMACAMDESFMYIVTEFMPRGALSLILQDRSIVIDMPTRLNFILDIAKGLNFLHSNNPPILHRDVKSLNILVDAKWNCKVADFGLTVFKTTQWDGAGKLLMGSVCWTAPEILEGEEYTEKADVYSFGIVLWELLTREQPFVDMNMHFVALQVVDSQLRPTIPDYCPMPYKELVESCWKQQSVLRPSFSAILQGLPTLQADLANFIEPTQRNPGVVIAPSGVVTVVVVETASIKDLWDWNSEVMQESLKLQQGTMRRELASARGYEVRCKFGVLVAAFDSPVRALAFCVNTQRALLLTEWPVLLYDHPACAPYIIEGATMFKGLRVCMGVHMGNEEPNSSTGQADFNGPDVNKAMKIAHYAKGGQIVVSEEVFKVVVGLPSIDEIGNFDELGMIRLKGLYAGEILYQFTPHELNRAFPAERSVSRQSVQSLPGKSLCFNVDEVVMSTFNTGTMPWMVKINEITLCGERIGLGNFGEVFKGEWRGQVVAVKKMLQQNYDQISLKHFMLQLKEIQILCELRHPNILLFMCACVEPPNVCVVTEWMEKGSLKEIISHQWPMEWSLTQHIVVSVANGITFLHESSFIHRDIKSSNVLVGKSWEVKIADFGLSRIKDYGRLMSICGTPAWTAPEVLTHSLYTEKADVYSFGILLWELLTGKKPFENMHHVQLAREVTKGVRPKIADVNSKLPVAFTTLMTACWDGDPNSRPNMREVALSLQTMC